MSGEVHQQGDRPATGVIQSDDRELRIARLGFSLRMAVSVLVQVNRTPTDSRLLQARGGGGNHIDNLLFERRHIGGRVVVLAQALPVDGPQFQDGAVVGVGADEHHMLHTRRSPDTLADA